MVDGSAACRKGYSLVCLLNTWSIGYRGRTIDKRALASWMTEEDTYKNRNENGNKKQRQATHAQHLCETHTHTRALYCKLIENVAIVYVCDDAGWGLIGTCVALEPVDDR